MKSIIKKIYLFCIYFIIYLPIIVLIIYSMNNAKYSLTWNGFSLCWYKELLYDNQLWSAFLNSIILGICVSLISTILGFFTCIYFKIYTHRYNNNYLYHFLLWLIIIPDLIFGISLLLFFRIIMIGPNFISLFIAHITLCLPFSILTINNQTSRFNPNIYFAACDLGASNCIIFTKIIFPLLWPSILSAFLLCFVISIDDVIVSYFVSGPDFTLLPLAIYSLVRTGITPELNALCTIIIVISIILAIIFHRLLNRFI